MPIHSASFASLPAAWQEASRREPPPLADPLPERRLARLLAAFIASGLLFLVLPGTLLGVWNLLGISSRQQPDSVSTIFVQSHGHAQLFGWVGTFIIGISLYVVPKFRGGTLRSLAAAWLMFGLWTAALAARWGAALWNWHWRIVWPLAAAAELAVALLLIWQCSPSGRSHRGGELWNTLVFAGFSGLAATLALQLVLLWPPPAAPLIPDHPNQLLLFLALWVFCFPAVWGFATRFLPALLGLEQPRKHSAYAGLALLALGAVLDQPVLVLGAAALACWSLRIFHPARRPAKTAGVDPRYPLFARAAFAWLLVSAALAAVAGDSRGLMGASRHAFTVGFLATLIFAVGPRLLPSFLNSRELWSPRLVLPALALLTAGCALRVSAEPLAYAGWSAAAWRLLPVSAVLELCAVLLFAYNIGRTLISPMPAWIVMETVHENLPLYWYVTAYPETRRLLAGAGLAALERAPEVPRALTLREAAEAEGVDYRKLVELLRGYFERRMARALRRKRA
jgi:hypothetical protein